MRYKVRYSGYIYIQTKVEVEADSFEDAHVKAPHLEEIEEKAEDLNWQTSGGTVVGVANGDWLYDLEVTEIVNVESGECKLIDEIYN